MSDHARVNLVVTDGDGSQSPFRADVWNSKGQLSRHWSDTGAAQLDVLPGDTCILVRRGIAYDAVELKLSLRASEQITCEAVLKERFSPRKLGWYGGESHMHVLHGRKDPPATIADGGRMARADGLEYLQLAWGWDRSFDWIPAAELNRQSAAASDERATVGWNIETPKCYMGPDHGGRRGNLHCYGHGWTVGLKDNSRGHDFFHTGPNFKIIQEVNRQGGIVGCAHPVRFWFENGNFVSNWASELPFDFVAGTPYAAVDILNDSPALFFESERFWYVLLNLGYKVAGTGNSDGALGANHGLGRYRTYTQIAGEFTWEKLAEGIKAGRCVASSGPFALFNVEGEHPGAEFPADGRLRRASIKAWSAPLPGEVLHSCQLVRNGEVVRAWDLRELKTREWQTEFDLRDEAFAWYCVRVLSTCADRHTLQRCGREVCELAVANPIYFLPSGFSRPQPVPARVQLSVTAEGSQCPHGTTVEVINGGEVIQVHELTGDDTLETPASASLRFKAAGYQPVERSIYMDCPEIFEHCRSIGTVWPSFFSQETYQMLRERLGKLRMTVDLRKLN